MYLPSCQRLDDRAALFELIDTHPLGTWVCAGEGGLIANHIPFILDRHAGPHGTLLGHVARGNRVWRAMDGATPSVVAFLGPQGYITPDWYPGKSAHGRVVPTWNYLAVHAHGVARVIEDPQLLLDLLQRLTDAQETPRATPWRVTDAPPDFIDQLIRGIVGIEIPIDRIEGRLKASQDETLDDRMGTVTGLRASGNPRDQALAELVERALPQQA